MQAKTLTLLIALAVTVSPAVAINGEMKISPASYNFSINASGGEYSQPLNLKWTGDETVTVYLDSTIIPNETENSEGITSETRKVNYRLNPGETKVAMLDIETSPALKPDSFEIQTKARLIIPEYDDGGGGGTTIVYRDQDMVVNQSTYEQLQNLTEDLNQTIDQQQQRIQDKEDQLSEKQQRIQDLQQQRDQLESQLNQTTEQPGQTTEDDFDLFVEDDRLDIIIVAGILTGLASLIAVVYYYREEIKEKLGLEEDETIFDVDKEFFK